MSPSSLAQYRAPVILELAIFFHSIPSMALFASRVLTCLP